MQEGAAKQVKRAERNRSRRGRGGERRKVLMNFIREQVCLVKCQATLADLLNFATHHQSERESERERARERESERERKRERGRDSDDRRDQSQIMLMANDRRLSIKTSLLETLLPGDLLRVQIARSERRIGATTQQ